MSGIDAPYLELGFYFSALSGDEAIVKVFRHLTKDGATCEGTVVFHAGPGIRGQPFSDITDQPCVSQKAINDQEIETLFLNENVRLLRLTMRSARFLDWSRLQILAQLRISPSCVTCDTHPIALWLDGSVLSHPPGNLPRKARRLGERSLESFRQLVSSLKPDYAAVTVDYGLECPCDIRVDPRTLAFQDFYLSEMFLGKRALAAVRRKAPFAHHEQTQDGQITCCSEWISPDGRFLPVSEADELSLFVGNLIASRGKEWRQADVRH